jgi:hypothetical protein
MKSEEKKGTRGKLRSPFFTLLFSLFSFRSPFCIIHFSLFIFLFFHFSLFSVGAQTVPEGGIPVAVMEFAGDEAALNNRSREVAIGEVDKQENFVSRPLNVSGPQPDLPPDQSLVGDLPYALTGEYYYDTEDMQHCQLWLWNSRTGALVYTDELVAEEIEEAVGYLPALVAWILSQISVRQVETVVVVPAAEEPPVEEPPPPPPVVVEEEPPPFPRLYLGARAGVGLDFQGVRPYGDYSGGMGQSFGIEGALTVEFRPWRFVSFQAEGIFALESFGAYHLASDADTYRNDRYRGIYLLLPLLVKVPFELGDVRVSTLAGVYYVVPLGKTLGGVSYRDAVLDQPVGIMAGIDLGYVPAGGKFGEVYGSLRYGIDLGLLAVEQTGLYYTRSRVILSVGWKMEIMQKVKRVKKEKSEEGRVKSEESVESVESAESVESEESVE